MAAIGVGIGIGFGASAQGFDWYVDSVNGSDSNDGKTIAAPLKSIATLLAKTITSGQRIGLARGSSWREQLTVPADGITVAAYGTGAKPLLDCSDIIAAGSWSKTAGYTYVYQVSVVIEQYPDQFMSLWEDDVRYTIAADLAACDSTAGTYYCADMSTSPATVYVHPADNSNPGTNGKKYEYPRRSQGVQCLFARCTISGLHTRRNLSNNGSLEVRKNCYVSDCLVSEGTKHNMLVNGGTVVSGVEVADAYYNGLSKVALVWNQDYGNDEDVTLINCYLHNTFDPAGDVGLYGHVNLGGHFGTVTIRGCRVENRYPLGGLDPATNVVVEGSTFVGQSNFAGEATLSDSTFTGLFRVISASHSTAKVTIRRCHVVSTGSNPLAYDCAIYADSDGIVFDVQDSTIIGAPGTTADDTINMFSAAGTVTLTSRNNVFKNYAHFYLIDGSTYTVDSDYNDFQAPIIGWFRLTWAWTTIAQWQALGHDVHSTY
jgi:hypothetical protein